MILADEGSAIQNEFSNLPPDKRATEIIKEASINVMSDNPVFLARLHLRELSLSKVNQLLLDFDLTAIEVEYIQNFIDTMIKKADDDSELLKNIAKLKALRESFSFYLNLINSRDDEIRKIIDNVDDINIIASYSTLIAKCKYLLPDTKDQLLLTDYENLLYEKKEGFKGN